MNSHMASVILSDALLSTSLMQELNVLPLCLLFQIFILEPGKPLYLADLHMEQQLLTSDAGSSNHKQSRAPFAVTAKHAE